MPVQILLCIAAALFLLPATSSSAQSKRESVATPAAHAAGSINQYAGKWTYRSYLNRPDIVVGDDAQKALDLIFGEAVMTFEIPDRAILKGTLDIGGGYVLDLTGRILGEPSLAPPVVRISGIGRPNTPTYGWEYDYVGYLAWQWPDGVAQAPAIVGTVERAKQHDQAKPGFVASFIATKQ